MDNRNEPQELSATSANLGTLVSSAVGGLLDRTAVTPRDCFEAGMGVVAAFVAKQVVAGDQLPELIESVCHAAARAGLVTMQVANKRDDAAEAGPSVEKPTPAQIRKSITPDALISFEDGKPYKTLKRHLRGCGLDPVSYRAKWGLPDDYPMVSANYSAMRSQMASEMGLGRKAQAKPRRRAA